MIRRKRDSYERYQDDLLDMERAFEEKVERKQKRNNAKEHPGSPKRDKKRPKAPLLLRILAGCGAILFFFVLGYLGAGHILNKINQQWPNDDDFRGGHGLSYDLLQEMDMQRTTFPIFYPRDGVLVSERVEVLSRTFEDNIREAVLRILDFSELGDAVRVLHVFRDIDTVYLDLSGSFLDALNDLGASRGTLLINAIVRTMNENFSLTSVRFLVESRLVDSGAPVDLSIAWQ